MYWLFIYASKYIFPQLIDTIENSQKWMFFRQCVACCCVELGSLKCSIPKSGETSNKPKKIFSPVVPTWAYHFRA